MASWKRICCPVDFSEPSRTALSLAADLGRLLGAELLLLHVEGAEKVAAEITPMGSAETQLAIWKEQAQRSGASRVSVFRTRGQPEVAICEFAKKNAADLIVMGTHGRVDRERMLIGSVAEGVVRKADCPVLTVHPGWKG